MSMTRFQRAFLATARHGVVALTIASITFSGNLLALPVFAESGAAPKPLAVTENSVATAPERFYLPALAAPGWASDSAGLYWQNGSTIEPFSQSVNDVPMVPYRLHEAEDSIAVELPSANGRQLIEFDRSAPSYRIYEYAPSEDAFVLTARQTLEFQAASEIQPTPTETPEPTEEPTPTPSEEPSPTPTPSEEPTPTPSEEPTPTPSESPSAFRWLRDLVGLSAHAEDLAWERVTISSVETTYEIQEGSVTITQSFQATTGDGTWPGYVRATFGFDGRSTINKWTYVIEDDDTPTPEFRLRAATEFAGNAEPIPGDARGAYLVTIVPEEVEPTPEPVPAEVPPTPTPEPEPEPVVEEPTPEPTESIEPTPEPETPTPAEEAPEEVPAPEEEPPAPPADEPISLLERAWRWLVPVASADEGSGALQWIQELFSSEEPLEFTVVFDVRDHDGEVTAALEENTLTTTFSGSDNAPDGTAFYVDPSFGALQDMQGITVQSGDGSNPADFKLHFDLASGGAVDELYQSGDFVTNRVATPASASGGLTLVNVGTAVQASQSATMTIEEASAVRVVVKNELPGLTERYSIYPSGRIVKAVVINTAEDTTADFYLNGKQDAYEAEAALPGDAIHLLTGPDADVLLAWQDPVSLASASMTSGTDGASRTTVASVPLVAGQHTFYQLIELSQASITMTDPASYLRHSDDYRMPDEPVMTRGTFLGFAPSRAAYEFEAINNVAVFRLNGSTIPRINPVFEVSAWSDPDLTAFKAQLNGLNMVEGVDYVIGFRNGDASTGVLLFQYLHTIQQGDQFNVEGDEGAPLFDLDPSDAAAIKRVQSGEFVMPTGSTVATIVLPFPVLTSRSWVTAGGLFEGSTNGTPSDPEKSRMTFWLESPTTVRVQRTAVGTGLASASWRVVEFEDNSGALVQRGSISFGVADTSLSATLPTPVNTTKAWAEVSVRGGSTDQANDERWTVRASLSATTLNLSRNESTIALQTTWQVIQLDGISVQRGLTSLAGATVTNVTIASVNLNKSFVVSTARAAAAVAGIDGQYHYLTRLTSSTNLRINKDIATNGVDVSWFVVTFTGTSGNRVRGGVLNYTASLTDLARSASVSPSVVATRSFVLGSEAGATGGDTADLDALTFGVRNLTADGDTIHVKRNYAGTARAASASWSVIEWTRPAIQQNRYRWRNDNGTEVTATALAAENASASLQVGQRKRLRFGLFNSDTGSATSQFRLEFTRKLAGGGCTTLSPGWTWRQVPVTPAVASDAFDMSDSPNFADAAATTNAAGVLTDDDTVFVPGETKDTGSQTSSIGLASTSFTEIEFALQPNSNAVAGNKYCFRVTDAGEARASHSFIFYPRFAEAEVTAAATFTQDTMRWYTNINAITPTDPWTPVSANLEENESQIYAHWAAPRQGTQIRLRMNVLAGAGSVATGSAAFTLQFIELPVGTIPCTAGVTWTDVGASTSGSVWRYGSNSAVTDNTTLPSTLLSTSDVRGSYEEFDGTASNSFAAAAGQSIEYDFSLQNNTAGHGSRSCFRLRNSDGTVLAGYNRYPAIVTQPSPSSPHMLMRHGSFFTVQGDEQPYYWAEVF